MKRAKSVDEFIAAADHWQSELVRLREILQKTTLTEEVKWGAPCYTWNGKNVVGIAVIKRYVKEAISNVNAGREIKADR